MKLVTIGLALLSVVVFAAAMRHSRHHSRRRVTDGPDD
jgi:hypothetical protein